MSRKTDAKDVSGITTKTRDIKLFPFVNDEFNPVRRTLADMLSTDKSTAHNGTILLQNVFPKFLKVTGRDTDVVPQLMHLSRRDDEDTKEHDDSYLYRNISLHLSTDMECCAHQKWWIVSEACDDPLYEQLLRKIPLNNCKYIMMFLFNEKQFPEGLSFISGLVIFRFVYHRGYSDKPND